MDQNINKVIWNDRIKQLQQSEIRRISAECARLGGINLSMGICQMPLPSVLAEAAKQAIDDGKNSYTDHNGIHSLREAIARKTEHFNRIRVTSEKQVIVSSGATGAFYSVCLALLNAGDEVIVFQPYYGYHVYTLMAIDAVPVFAELKGPNWMIDWEHLKSLITNRTKAIVINTPANPCGKVFTLSELEELLELAIQHNLLIFADEIYEYTVYDGQTHTSIGSLDNAADRVVTISGYSKIFSITGWRIGYCICPDQYADRIGSVNDLVYGCPPAPLQVGVAVAIDQLPDTFYTDVCRKYWEKRDKLCTQLQASGFVPHLPQGGFYVLAEAHHLPGNTAIEKATFLLKKTGVAAVPGTEFYWQRGEYLLRFCFAVDQGLLDRACERLAEMKRWRGTDSRLAKIKNLEGRNE